MIFRKIVLKIAAFFLITHFFSLSSQNSGLPNTRNNCYLNSFFQCFTNLELVRNLLIDNQELYKKPSVPFDFIELIKNIRKNPSTPYEHKECIDQFINERFKQKTQQQDCQEALLLFIGSYLMNSEQFLIKNQNLAKAIQDYTTTCEVNTSLLADKSYLFLKTLCDLIHFTDEVTTSCPDSKSHVAIKKEKNITLSLDIIKCKSLQDCLIQRYLGKEILDNDNAWFCNNCKKKVNATKEFRLC